MSGDECEIQNILSPKEEAQPKEGNAPRKHKTQAAPETRSIDKQPHRRDTLMQVKETQDN